LGDGMAHFVLQNLDHKPEIARALGDMVVAWSYAEGSLISVMWRITSLDHQAAAVAYYRIPTFEARVKFIYALLSEWKTKKYKVDTIRVAVEKLAKLSRPRNDWIHGNWCRTADFKKQTFLVDYREPPGSRKRTVTIGAIKNHSATVIVRAQAIKALVG
jgi:hypothetical protein